LVVDGLGLANATASRLGRDCGYHALCVSDQRFLRGGPEKTPGSVIRIIPARMLAARSIYYTLNIRLK
jgi:hypothetical protein